MRHGTGDQVEPIGAPCWCSGQPQLNALNEPVLWLRREQNRLCFHDGGEVKQKFICQQGETKTKTSTKCLHIGSVQQKCVLKDNNIIRLALEMSLITGDSKVNAFQKSCLKT